MGRASGASDNPRLHPTRGIGWIGVVGVVILFAIAAGEIISPLGLRYEFLRLIDQTTPWSSYATLLTASTLIICCLSVAIYVSYGVLALVYILPAFWLAPRERTLLRFVLIPLWCVAETVLLNSVWGYQVVTRVAMAIGMPSYYEYMPLLIAATGHFVLLWLATRTLRIPMILIGLLFIAAAWGAMPPTGSWSIGFGLPIRISLHEIEFPGAAIFAISWHVFVIHGVMAFVMIRWALRERRRATSTTACQTCGYSLEGIASNICPECGGARAA